MDVRMRFATCLFLSTLITLTLDSVYAAAPSKDDADPLAGLNYRLLGPAVSGRMTRVAGIAGSRTFYASAAQGGLWKSTDDGHAWQPIFDAQDTQSVGSFALAPSDANVMYVGSGEANIRGNVALGYGIWKSDDAGHSFTQVLKLRGQIGTMQVHPSNPDIAFAAVLGNPFAASKDRGVYRTLDGGKSWQNVLFIDADTGASDIAISESNPRVVFAGFWQARRTPWGLTSGGPGSGLQRSLDGGQSWTALDSDAGLPEKPWGKVGVAIAPSDCSRVYALIEAKNGGLFRSDDGGESFVKASGHRVLRQRAWYYSTMRIDPHNPDVVWFPQVGLVRTKDGGKTLQRVPGTGHGDHHDVWIDPRNTQRVIEANDGGLGISADGGTQWLHPALPTGQFYNVDVDNRTPYHVGGTMQDMGTASGPSALYRSSGANLSDWRVVGGGEAGDFAYDPNNVGEIYAGEYGGFLSHFNEATGQTRSISSVPQNPSGIHASEQAYRFQWTAPVLASVHGGALYHGANRLFKSTDQGASWTLVSPDLTRNDKTKQGWSGGPITGDITGAEYYNTIFSLAESPDVENLLYAGTDDGLLHITTDGGNVWRNITPKALPEFATIEAIHVPRGAPDSAWVVAHNYRLGDDAPYLFKTTDRGVSWTRMGGNLPADLTLWTVRTDPADPRYVYLGSQRGVWYSSNSGVGFAPLKLNLPQSTVTDLETKHGDLIVATRGRALWVLENLSALRAFESAKNTDIALLPSASATRFANDDRWGDGGSDAVEGKQYGVAGYYWLKTAVKATPKNAITLTVLDASGTIVRRLSSTAKKSQYADDDADQPTEAPKAELTGTAGLNTFQWDLHADGATALLRSKLDSGDAETGPLVPAGRYTLKLQVGALSAQSQVEVLNDPRSKTTAADIAADYAFANTLISEIDRARQVIEAARALRRQLDAQMLALDAAGATPTDAQAQLRSAGLALRAKLDTLEGSMHNPSARVVYDVLAGRDGGAKLYHQLVPLYYWAQSSDDAPTSGMKTRHAELQSALVTAEASYKALQNAELAQYKKALAASGGMIELTGGTAP
jgi:photosystem II stability/assembly factor-like uncharacterized protein